MAVDVGRVGRRVEVGDHLVDAELGPVDALAAERDEVSGARDPIGQPVDVDVAALELAQDGVELVAMTHDEAVELLEQGLRLGPVGGTIVGEVFIGLLQLAPGSYLRDNPGFRPTLPRRNSATFTMVDLLTYARVDPTSRGQ